MDPRTRRLAWGWWALAFLALVAGVFVVYRRIEANRGALAALEDRCRQLRRGMTEAEVRRILGPPEKPNPLAVGRFFTYTSDARTVIVAFDSTNRAEPRVDAVCIIDGETVTWIMESSLTSQ